MFKLDLQLFSEAVQGKKLVYLFRPISKESTSAGTALALRPRTEGPNQKMLKVLRLRMVLFGRPALQKRKLQQLALWQVMIP